MLAESDSYNRLISGQEIKQSYHIFKTLLIKHSQKSSKVFHCPTTEQILSQPPTSNPLHKVVALDCHRTRSTNFTEEQKKKLESVLNYFVRVHEIEYKQGLNEIAALFVLWARVGVPLTECYQMFEKFFIKFSLNFYYDKDFTGLEMFFRMISLVLRYHCPSLSRYLAVYDIEPQIYALSWLMTLFSSKLSLHMTYLLWSYLIAENDKYLLFFIVVGIIIHRKDEIIQTKNSSIFKIVTDMVFKREEELEEVVKISLILRKNTPVSLTTFFEEKQLFDRLESYKQSAELLEHITRLNVFVILPKQLYSSKCQNPPSCNLPISLTPEIQKNTFLQKFILISKDIKKIPKKIEFVIIDLRKQKTRLNSINQVYSVDICEPFQHIQSEFLNEYLQQMSSKHFTILLTSFTFEDSTFSDREQFSCAKKFLNVLNSYSFPSLGILEGGYTALSIYEQEFRIRQAFQRKEQKNMIQIKSNLDMIGETELMENVLMQGQHELNIPLSLLFSIAELKYSGRIKLFNGSDKLIIIVSECFLIVLSDIQNLIQFMSYLQHNFSIAPYFYSNFKNITCKLLKILPISRIKKIKTKGENETFIIVKFLQEVEIEEERRRTIQVRLQSWKSNPGQIEGFLGEEFRRILVAREIDPMKAKSSSEKVEQTLNLPQQKQKKLILSLKDKETLKQFSASIQHSYKVNLKKKYVTSLNKSK